MTLNERRRALMAMASNGKNPVQTFVYTSPGWTSNNVGNAKNFADTYFNNGNGFYCASIENNTVTAYRAVSAWKIALSYGSNASSYQRNGGVVREDASFSYYISAGATITVHYYPESEMGL